MNQHEQKLDRFSRRPVCEDNISFRISCSSVFVDGRQLNYETQEAQMLYPCFRCMSNTEAVGQVVVGVRQLASQLVDELRLVTTHLVRSNLSPKCSVPGKVSGNCEEASTFETSPRLFLWSKKLSRLKEMFSSFRLEKEDEVISKSMIQKSCPSSHTTSILLSQIKARGCNNPLSM